MFYDGHAGFVKQVRLTLGWKNLRVKEKFLYFFSFLGLNVRRPDTKL